MSKSVVRSREELANALSHGVGLMLAVAASPVLIIGAARRESVVDLVASTVFALTMVSLYLASTWYHATPISRLKDRLRKLDHAAIYLLIAGTYTPFTLGVLRGPWGWALFALVWSAAAVGVCEKLIAGIRRPRLSTVLYLLMGWSALLVIRPLVTSMPREGIAWLVAGGLSYTAGTLFYSAERLPYNHLIWHLFVLSGTTCHFFAVLWYAA